MFGVCNQEVSNALFYELWDEIMPIRPRTLYGDKQCAMPVDVAVIDDDITDLRAGYGDFRLTCAKIRYGFDGIIHFTPGFFIAFGSMALLKHARHKGSYSSRSPSSTSLSLSTKR